MNLMRNLNKRAPLIDSTRKLDRLVTWRPSEAGHHASCAAIALLARVSASPPKGNVA